MRKNKIKLICPICNNLFEVHPCKIKEGKGKYCSRKCMGIARSSDPLILKLMKELGERKKGKSTWMKGRHHTEESKLKLSDAHKGKILSKETIDKLKGRIPWNKGKTGVYSMESLKKLSISHLGNKQSEETKLKIGISSKGRKMSNEAKIKIREAHLGKTHSEESKRKISAGKMGDIPWNKGSIGLQVSWIKGKTHSPETKKKLSEAQSKAIAEGKFKFKDTIIELAIEQELKKAHLNYEKQKYIKGVGCVDFYIPEQCLIIECDGDYWHKINDRPQKDADRDLRASFSGYKTIRLWEHEIKDNIHKCFRKVINITNGDY